MDILFRKTRALEKQIDEYLDKVVNGGLVLKQGVRFYLDGRLEDFEIRMRDLRRLENQGDELRRRIESRLYGETLIPESRGDVLGLLESTDRVLNQCSDILKEFAVEQPAIPSEVKELFAELAEASVASAEAMVMAIRSYFREPRAVRDHIARSQFYEKESDRIAENIKRRAFDSDIELARKFHIRYFALHLEKVSDSAEDVCDRLAIAAIKRSL